MKAASPPPVLRLALLIAGLSASAVAQNVTFPDAALEARVRSALAKPSGTITASDMQSLRFLDACCAGITNLSGLEWATSLTNLDLSRNAISNVAPVGALSNLLSLDLGGNAISDAEPLGLLTNLRSLRLYSNPLQGVDPISNLTQLTSLTVYSDGISNATPLIGLTNLTYLELRWNPLTNPGPVLSVLTNLKVLYLGGTSLSDIDFLQNLTQLEFLNLDHNALNTVPPLLSLLPNLTGLDLGYNPLDSIVPIASLTNLRSLYLSGVGAYDLSPLYSLPALEVVSASRNSLTSLFELENLPALSQVNVRYNHLDISPGSPAMTVIGDLIASNVYVVYLPQDQPPTLTAPSTWTVAGGSTSWLDFTISDDLTSDDQLVVTATPSDSIVIHESEIFLSGIEAVRRLTVTPADGQTGTATITLTVTDDGGLQTNWVIVLTVIAPEPVSFPDPALERAIRSQLSKPTGDITKLDLYGLTYLGVFDAGVTNLSGLEFATNLTTLFLGGNDLVDVTPIQNLVSLRYLAVDDNPFTNISTLTGLTNLLMVFLQEDFITDVAPLLTLPHLVSADVEWNLLDVAATNSLDLPVIQNLQQLGVQVDYLPQRGPPSFVTYTNWIISSISPAVLYVNIASGDPHPEPLTVVGHSSNTNLLPDNKFTIHRETDLFWSVTINSSLNQTGMTTITLTTTNLIGMSSSASIFLTVKPPLPLDGGAVNSSGLTWLASPSAPWFAQTAVTYDGVSALQSAPIGDGQDSWVVATVQGPGTLSFWWKVSSETNRDYLEFEIDGNLQPTNLSGETDWQQQAIAIPFGTHNVRWMYSKDPECCTEGLDAAWLDQVIFAPANWLELAGSTNGQPTIVLHARPGTLHELQSSTNLSSWNKFALLPATNTTTRFVDTVPISSKRFYRTLELPADAVRLNAALLTNEIQLLIQSPLGCRLYIQSSTDLKTWTQTASITNDVGVYDLRQPTSGGSHYFRAVVIP